VRPFRGHAAVYPVPGLVSRGLPSRRSPITQSMLSRIIRRTRAMQVSIANLTITYSTGSKKGTVSCNKDDLH
jgi:hypothetical protein